MRTLKLILAYDGAAYSGWQFQADAPTIQAALETAIARISSEAVRVTGSGRTDAGVHAIGQMATFSTASALPADVWQRALNAHLPHDIRVLSVSDVPPTFHAIRNTVRKRYRYVIDDSPHANPFLRHFAWHRPRSLDVDAMREAAALLLGRHDFRSFETAGSPRPTTVREILALEVVRRDEPAPFSAVQIEAEADGFLYNMVRNIVGSLVQVGAGKRSVAWISEVLAACDRRAAGPCAPPQGLYLLHVVSDDQPNAKPTESN